MNWYLLCLVPVVSLLYTVLKPLLDPKAVPCNCRDSHKRT